MIQIYPSSVPLSSYLLTYLLTPWCRVLLEKLTGLQLVKKFPAFHGTRKFITALKSVRHQSLSWASPIQSIYPHPTSWRSILILSTHLCLGLPSGLLPSGFPTKTLYTSLSSSICASYHQNLCHKFLRNVYVLLANLHDVTSRKTEFFIETVVKASNQSMLSNLYIDNACVTRELVGGYTKTGWKGPEMKLCWCILYPESASAL